jgi:RimJ/RimL family protein N-acetyltransferase
MALEGNIVRLREQREGDLPLLVRMRNDLETQAWSKVLPPDFTLPMYRKWFMDREINFDRRDGRFIIEQLEDQAVVGYAGYYGLVPRHKVFYGLALTGEIQGRGIALDAQEILLKFFFEEMGLQVVRIHTHSGNPAMMRLAEKSGLQIAVRNRQAIFQKGQLFDNLMMDITREDYYNRHPELKDRFPYPGRASE